MPRNASIYTRQGTGTDFIQRICACTGNQTNRRESQSPGTIIISVRIEHDLRLRPRALVWERRTALMQVFHDDPAQRPLAPLLLFEGVPLMRMASRTGSTIHFWMTLKASAASSSAPARSSSNGGAKNV